MERTNDMEYFEIDSKYYDDLTSLPEKTVGGMVKALCFYVWQGEDVIYFEDEKAQALFEKLKADCDKQIAEYKASMVK